MSKMSHLAIIGCGNWGKNFIHTIADTPNSVCKYIISTNPSNKQFASESTQILPHFSDLLSLNDLDGAIITTPSSTHYPIAKTLIEQHIPVIIEKPMTTDLADAQQLCQLAQTIPIPIFVNHTHLFNPIFRQFIDLARRYGPIKTVRSISGKWIPQPKPILWELGPHDIAMCLELLGTSPSDHFIEQISTKHEHAYSESFCIHLTFDDIDCELIISNSLSEKTRRFECETESHIITFEDYTDKPICIRQKQGVNTLRYPNILDSRRPLHVLVDEFSRSIQLRRFSEKQLHLGCQVVRILSNMK